MSDLPTAHGARGVQVTSNSDGNPVAPQRRVRTQSRPENDVTHNNQVFNTFQYGKNGVKLRYFWFALEKKLKWHQNSKQLDLIWNSSKGQIQIQILPDTVTEIELMTRVELNLEVLPLPELLVTLSKKRSSTLSTERTMSSCSSPPSPSAWPLS